ncbi:hypothetical protein UA08_02724 [Talaromyces atroroseus]|uniref:Homeobox domain-containing protein n=1 Tax=Talaromyces atroroseus TaxID=1441469 RepID=A0A225B810_TALAT|nr:hypothetical protein UA08_02724 [Talaromyces atroroseus]OKL62077.1 hypothetical protein UA08_02724 [Talaromyces atroroseus]
MSMVSVYRSVPSPQSDLYRYSRAPDSIVLRSPGSQGVEESKMGLSTAAPSILAPSIKDSSQPGPGAQREASSSLALPRPAAAQFTTQLPKLENIDPSLKPITHLEVEDAKGQNQVSQTWNGGDSTMSVAAPSSHGPDILGEENDEELAGDLSNGEDADGGHVKSAGDAGDDKKKSKRFRLTHNQTRFLMSEFTRQAHPDASHRERLSREIPGLSPRQVQVWFQNRRAKLKRLTSQDRDRVLKSRALPEHFDRTQMLHQPYNSRPSANTSPTSPTTSRPSFPSGAPKPLAVSNITRNPGEDYPVSPASAASAYGSYVNSPGLAEPFSSASNNPGNAVTAGGASTTFSATHALPRVPGVHSDYNRSHSFSTSYAPGWQPYPSQRLHLPPSDSGIKPENMNSMHRPSASYPGLAGSIPESPYERHSSQASSAGHGTATQSNSPLPGMAYQGGQSQGAQTEQYPASTQDSHDAYTSGNYRHVLTLQTAQLPPPQEYQVSPFTPSYSSSYSFDSFYPYAHDNTSAVSLPASYMRSHTGYESPGGYSYDNNDMNRIATSNLGGAR